MEKDISDEISSLKKDYFDLVEIRREEKETLLKVIHTFGLLAPLEGDIAQEIQGLKTLVNQDEELALGEIELRIGIIKNKILQRARDSEHNEEDSDPFTRLHERLIDACRIIKRLMADILDDFYPVPEEMKAAAADIKIDCKGDVSRIDIQKPSEDLLKYIKIIKRKISEDFREINRSFFSLLSEVKDLEKSLSSEFGNDKSLKDVDYFEMKINSEVGSIAESFNLYTTITEVKAAVVEKLKNIRKLVSIKKKEELRKSRLALDSITKLKDRITRVEQAARDMSKKAKRFQTAAMRDSLTGLYNRSEFDLKIKNTLLEFEKKGERFSVIIFDVDKFKNINDTLGHVAGDRVLKKVAECLTETFRKDDFLARYGGDEFVVIIEGLTKDIAQEKIRNFNDNLRRKRFISHKKGEIKLTVSTGMTMVVEGDTTDSLLERADNAMYASKKKKQI